MKRAETELTNTTVQELSDLVRVARKLRDFLAFKHFAEYGVVPQIDCIREADEVLKRYCVPTATASIVKYETCHISLEEEN